MEPFSAGLAPASIVQSLTKQVMEAKNININHQYPKDVATVDPAAFDVIINMSGRKFPSRPGLDVREWKVEDPIGKEESVYIAVRDQIEMSVMQLILQLRRETSPPEPPRRNRRSLEKAKPPAAS
jgi:arsenate reductase (thioredoxin)